MNIFKSKNKDKAKDQQTEEKLRNKVSELCLRTTEGKNLGSTSSATSTTTKLERYEIKTEIRTSVSETRSLIVNKNLSSTSSNTAKFDFSLPTKKFSVDSANQESILGLTNNILSSPIKSDALAFKAPSINLNYQSPYRNSPVYRSYNAGTKLNSPSAIRPSTSSNLMVSSSSPSISSTTLALSSECKDKKLKVVKTGKRYDDQTSAIPIYKTSGKKRGEALIINNVEFLNESRIYRDGAKKDEKDIIDLFTQLGFRVQCKNNLKKSQMENVLRTFSKNSSLKSVDISIVVIMSHGHNRNFKGGYTEIFGTNGEGLDTDKILSYFTTQNCPNMAQKPKIFIFQCCRGDGEGVIEADAQVFKSQPHVYEDMLIAHSTLPGFVSYRNVKTGTWYIQTICEVFSKHAHEYDVETMLKIVDRKIAELSSNMKQVPNYESRGFKRCYLNP